ncbi:MAG: zinc-dependent alcohol dehydrogenase [Aeromicrobium sp.]
MSAASQRVLVVRAEDKPIPGTARPAARQRFRFPMLSVEERTLGELARDAVRVSMTYVGVCGSDIHLVTADPATGYVLSSVQAHIDGRGRVLGHEGVGTVLAVGSDVTHVVAGDVVVFASLDVCQECEQCRRGKPNQCRSARLLGMETDGLFGTTVDVSASLAHRVTDVARTDEDLQALACVEPAANAAVACAYAEVGPNDSVIVFGAGPIGLYCAMMCRVVHGARRVVVVEPRQLRRRLAEPWCDAAFGVEEFLSGDESSVDVIFEASGAMQNVTRSMGRVAPQGRVVLLGRSGEPLLLDELDHVISEAITIRGCRGHLGGAIDQVVQAYADGILPLGAIVTGVVDSLDALADKLRAPGSIGDDHSKLLARLGDQLLPPSSEGHVVGG